MKNSTKSVPHQEYAVYINIDGQLTIGTPTTKEKFIKLFKDHETLLYSDDRKYWVLYEEINAFPWSVGEYQEIFWCIPTSEINFIYDKGIWRIIIPVSTSTQNTPKKIRKEFDNWVSKNFKGLSAYTLTQLLKSETILSHEYIDEMVYVDLFNMFIGKTNDETQNKFDACTYWVSCISWL